MRLKVLPVVAAAGAAILAAWTGADANFAAAEGFSGMNGVTCVSCHVVPHPIDGDAVAVLDGLPDGWAPGASYKLTVRVEGGPMALPTPAPQGGFEVATDAGTFSVPPGMEGLLRQPRPWSMTYTPEGTLMREWQVTWNAPTLAGKPAPANLWLAVLAANGNHVVLTNTSDAGEKYDATASLQRTVPPAAGLLEAWRALPLAAPEVAQSSLDGGAWTVAGRHADANATHLAWSLDGAPWKSRATGPAWQLFFPGLARGDHRLELRSEGAERTSPRQALLVEGGEALPPGAAHDTPAPPLTPALLAAFLATFLLRRPRP